MCTRIRITTNDHYRNSSLNSLTVDYFSASRFIEIKKASFCFPVLKRTRFVHNLWDTLPLLNTGVERNPRVAIMAMRLTLCRCHDFRFKLIINLLTWSTIRGYSSKFCVERNPEYHFSLATLTCIVATKQIYTNQ